MNAKPTPGPWYVLGQPWHRGPRTIVIAGSEDPHLAETVADCDNSFGTDFWETETETPEQVERRKEAEWEANARLIAEAPEMLELLRQVSEQLEAGAIPVGESFWDAWGKKAKEILRRVVGGQ